MTKTRLVARWLTSPLYHLLAHDQKEMRERMNVVGYHSQFPMLNDLKANGATDYFATGLLFEKPKPNGEIDPNNTQYNRSKICCRGNHN